MRKLFEEADEVKLAVAFLKNSGYATISDVFQTFCKNKTKKSTLFVGLGMGSTDPKALRKIHAVIKGNVNHELILCTPDAGIFHPKLYVFIKNSIVKIIIGSANMTEGGWLINDEVSALMETKINSPVYDQLDTYLANLHTGYYSNDVGALIDEYEQQLNEYRKTHLPSMGFKFRSRKRSALEVDQSLLKAYLKKYPYSKDYIDPVEREERYEKAKANLDIIASATPLTRNEFEALFGPLVGHAGYNKLWHSGSIHRKSYPVLDHISVFRQLVRLIKKNIGKSPAVVFELAKNFAKEKIKVKQLGGVGVNIITEILMTYNPQQFPNLNKNPLTVLALVGKECKVTTSFTGEDYEEYSELLLKISAALHMNSLLEIDSFFNYIYWNLLEENK